MTAVNVDVGQSVSDEVLLELDHVQSKLQLEALKAQRQGAEARAAVRELQHRAKVSERQHLEREHQRQEQLLSGGGGSIQQSQTVAQRLDQARFQEQTLLAQHQLAQAELEQADIAVEKQEDQLKRHSLKAPLEKGRSYTVAERNVELGENVSPGQTLFELIDTERVMFSVLVDEREWRACKEKNWSLQTLSGQPLEGFDVYFFSPRVSGSSRKRELRFEGKANAQVQGGQSVSLLIKLPSNRGGLLVPQNYLGDLFGQTMVRCKDGSTIPVQVLRKEGDFTVVEPSSLPLNVELLPMGEELES